MSTTLLVGDSHANATWWMDTVVPAALAAATDRIVQVGDFGWWPTPEGIQYNTVSQFVEDAANSPVPVYFIEGNHEHHHDLVKRINACTPQHQRYGWMSTPVHLFGNLFYWDRGATVIWDDVRIMGMGGAHSIDRGARTEGVSWFPEEHITDNDILTAKTRGHVDVLICHDAPSVWQVPGVGPDVPPEWVGELPACEAHRGMVRRVMENATPDVVVHGHYHTGYARTNVEPWGPVETWGLNRDGSPHSLAVMTTNKGAVTIETVEVP